ncbi:MAG: aldehyde dehydrogenase family protein, partial [Burkholderiales bacterium]
LVPAGVHDAFVERMKGFVESFVKVGDPADASTILGPVIRPERRAKIEEYIESGVREGAKLVTGGGRPRHLARGWFVEPTIFTGVNNSMRIAQEEIFGPVLSVIPFKDEEEAVAIGNDVVYGLAAGVWTQNMRRSLMMAERLQAGTVWVNTYRAVSYLSPFGGYKRSGLGRESGQEMIKD